MKRFMGTPGPWKYTIRNVNEMMTTFHGVVMGDTYIEIATRNEREDAKLLAAAPDLLEALQSIIDLQTRGYVVIGDKYTDMARAAISKALGEE